MRKKAIGGLLTAVLGIMLYSGISFAGEPGEGGKTALEFKPKIGGYIEGWYRNDDSVLSGQATAAKKADNEFRVRRARLTASGNLTEELGYRLTASLDGPSPASSASSVKLWDAYMSYAISPLAAVTFGQFKYGFSLEGLESTPDRMPVLRAEAVNDIAGKLGTKGGSFRDIGVKLNGSVKKYMGIAYSLDVINGSGINTGDNNSRKDFVARVTFSPVEKLALGASWYSGEGQDQTEERFKVDERAYGVDAEYSGYGVRLRAEYLEGVWKNWDAASGAAVQGKKQRPNGWYMQASCRLPQIPGVEVLARYEDYEKDSYTGNSRLRTATLGGTYYLKGKTRITANYLIRNPQGSPIVTAQETDATGSNIGDLFLMQALLAF